MSSTASASEEHAYFLAIEEAFIRLRGAPLLLSPADWQVASGWRRKGIPLALVLETLEVVFARRAERHARGRIQGLRYCARAVEEAWQDHESLVATGRRKPRPEIDVGARLAALAEAVQAKATEGATLAAKIRGLKGSPEQIEGALMVLDGELLETERTRLDHETRDSIQRSVEGALVRLQDRIAEEDRSRIRERLERRAVRQHANLPVLSLFAPEAEERA